MEPLPIRIDDGDGVWPPDNYTGVWAYHWPNKALKYRAFYVNGMTKGEVLCYWDNGQLAQRGFAHEGRCRGVWTDFGKDGSKLKETDYTDDLNFTVRYFDFEGAVMHTETWRDGEIIHEEVEPSDEST